MVPGIQSPPTTTPPPSSAPAAKKPSSPLSQPLPSASATSLPQHQPDGPSATFLTTAADTWDEVRDAISETPLAKSLLARVHIARSVAHSLWNLSRNAAWVVGTSALVLVVPLLYEIDKELGPDNVPTPGTAEQSSQSAQTATVADAAQTDAPAQKSS